MAKSQPFVMIVHEVLDSEAWRTMSHGAKSLYIALKRYYIQSLHNNGKIFLPKQLALILTKLLTGFASLNSMASL